MRIVETLSVTPRKNRMQLVLDELDKVSVGQTLILDREEFTSKNSVRAGIWQRFNMSGKKFRTAGQAADGLAISRIK